MRFERGWRGIRQTSMLEDPETSAAALLRPLPCPPTKRFRWTKLSQYWV